jgi:hypothetical protein
MIRLQPRIEISFDKGTKSE